MKSIFFLLSILTSVLWSGAKAQNLNYNLNEINCFCKSQTTTPPNIIKLDNNWELLLTLRQQKTKEQLDSTGVQYTDSQLRLLQAWRLLQRNNNDSYKTSIVILDSISTLKLRGYSMQLSVELSNVIKPTVLELISHLQKMNRDKNTYTILFSYALDGLTWDQFEKEELTEPREISLITPNWAGEFWTTYPKRDFACGTNSVTENGFSMSVNWTEKAIPKMIPFVTRFDLQGRILDDFINHGKLVDKEAMEVFETFNFFNDEGEFTVPIITENEDNNFYSTSMLICKQVTQFLKSEIDWEVVINEYDFKNTSQAVIILYHEMMWDILEILEGENIIEKPIAFKNPKQATPSNISDLIFFTKK